MSLAAIPRYDSDISGEKAIPIAIIRPAYRTVNHHSGVWAVKQRVGMVVIKHRLKPVQTNALIPWRSYKRPTTAPTKALTTAPGKRINPVSALDWWSEFWAKTETICSVLSRIINSKEAIASVIVKGR